MRIYFDLSRNEKCSKKYKKIQKWLTLNRNKVEKSNQKFENFN